MYFHQLGCYRKSLMFRVWRCIAMGVGWRFSARLPLGLLKVVPDSNPGGMKPNPALSICTIRHSYLSIAAPRSGAGLLHFTSNMHWFSPRALVPTRVSFPLLFDCTDSHKQQSELWHRNNTTLPDGYRSACVALENHARCSQFRLCC